MGQGQIRTISAAGDRNLSVLVHQILTDHVGQDRAVETRMAAQFGCVSAKTMQRYLRGDTVPDLVCGLRLMKRLPDQFTADLLGGIGMAGTFRVNGSSPPAETLREMLEAAAALAAAWTDQRIDHTEWPGVKAQMTEAMNAIAGFLANQGGRR